MLAYVDYERKKVLFWSVGSATTDLDRWFLKQYLASRFIYPESTTGGASPRMQLDKAGHNVKINVARKLVSESGFQALVIARHPFTRAVSTYINRFVIGNGRQCKSFDDLVLGAAKLMKTYYAGSGKQPAAFEGLSFLDYLKLIQDMVSPRRQGGMLDPIFGPQLNETDRLEFDVLAKLDTPGLFPAFEAFFGINLPVNFGQQFGIVDGPSDENLTNVSNFELAKSNREFPLNAFNTPETVALCADIFAHDYKTFDYSVNPNAPLTPSTVIQGSGMSGEQQSASANVNANANSKNQTSAEYSAKIHSISNVVCVPFDGPPGDFPKPCGAWHSDKPQWLRHQRMKAGVYIEAEPDNLSALLDDQTLPLLQSDKPYLFGGFYFGHFGHFLSESLCRLWPLFRAEGGIDPQELAGIVFIYGRDVKGFIPPFVRRFCDLIGIDIEKFIFITAETRVQNMLVPEQSGGLNIQPGAEYWPIQNRVQKNILEIPKGPKSIFFVRRRHYRRRGCFLGEILIAQALEAAGFVVYEPETLSVDKQLALLRDAENIIFSEGSSMYNLLLTPCHDKRIAVLQRRQMDIMNGLYPDNICQTLWVSEQMVVLKDLYPNVMRAPSYVNIAATVKKLAEFFEMAICPPSEQTIKDQLNIEVLWQASYLMCNNDEASIKALKSFTEAVKSLPIDLSFSLNEIQQLRKAGDLKA